MGSRKRNSAGCRSKPMRGGRHHAARLSNSSSTFPRVGQPLASKGKDRSGVSRDTTPTGNAGQPDEGGGNGIVSGCNEVFSSKVWVDHRIASGCVRVGCRHLARALDRLISKSNHKAQSL